MADVRLATWHVATPLSIPATTALHRITEIHSILVELTDGTYVGHGYASAFTLEQARAIHALVRDLSALYTDTDLGHPEERWIAALSRLNFIGRTGIALFALAALDTAAWDLRARQAEIPLARLLGSERKRLPVYATGGWLTTPLHRLVEEAGSLIERGYAGVKIKVGQPDWRDDLRRLEAVRRAVGDEIALMADANQAWDIPTAVRAGQGFADLGLTWLEEPVDADDVDATAEVRGSVSVPLASGETRFGTRGVLALADGAVDVLMFDLAHVGGVTPFLDVADVASDRGIQLSSHTFTELSLPLLSAAPTGRWVEHVPGWWDPLFERPAAPPTGGFLTVPTEPGTGVSFSERIKHDYAI